MIRTQEMVPDYYVEKSRDFQVLCRLYDYTLNSLKYNVDSMLSLTDTRAVKDTILPLMGDKFGIYDSEAYTNRQLLEALPIAVKHKGSLKGVKILLNAFLDSMEVFDYAVAYHSKDKQSAEEISALLNRKVDIYTVVIILSTVPSLTNLHILNEYMQMVIPTGMKIEYSFGIIKKHLDKFKYSENTFLYYTHTEDYGDDEVYPYIGFVKNKNDRYKIDLKDIYYPGGTFIFADKKFIKITQETIDGPIGEEITYKLKHTALPDPNDESIGIKAHVYMTNPNENTGRNLDLDVSIGNEITFVLDSQYTLFTVQYYCNKEEEFINRTISDVDINSVSLGTVEGKVKVEEE